MNNNKLPKKIFSVKILQTRHDHFLQVEDLAGFSGLTEIQIRSLEEGVNKENCFVDDAHAIDCAKRVASCLGFTHNYFLSPEKNLHHIILLLLFKMLSIMRVCLCKFEFFSKTF